MNTYTPTKIAKRSRGQPAHVPTEKTRAKAIAYAECGVPHHDIALLIGVSIKTLLKHYDDELKMGKANANAKVAQTLYRQAINGSLSAAIYWSKTQMGWREVNVLEHTGKDGGPIPLLAITTNDPEEASRAYLKLISQT